MTLDNFPLQKAVNAEVTAAENERLQASMQADGRRDLVHVLPVGNTAGLPGNTVLDGHRRRDAAVALGWAEVDVIVRNDLADADFAAVAEVFFDFNLNRRQLNTLDQAVAVVRRHELQTGRPADRWTGDDLNVVTAAEKVFSLKPCYREQIADAVHDATRNNPGGKVNDIVLDAVHELIPQREPSEDKLTKHLDNIRKAAEGFIADYDARLDRITHPSWAENHLDNVMMAHDFLGRLRNQLAEVRHNPDPLIERIHPFDERNQDD